MERSIALGLGIGIGLGGSAMGQESPRMTTDTTITMGASEYRICQDRPPRPDWIENIAVKEAYRALIGLCCTERLKAEFPHYPAGVS